MEKMIDDGELTASLGVSNYRPKDLEPLLKAARYKPVVNRAYLFFTRLLIAWVVQCWVGSPTEVSVRV